jgi:hypothetical protein
MVWLIPQSPRCRLPHPSVFVTVTSLCFCNCNLPPFCNCDLPPFLLHPQTDEDVGNHQTNNGVLAAGSTAAGDAFKSSARFTAVLGGRLSGEYLHPGIMLQVGMAMCMFIHIYV